MSLVACVCVYFGSFSLLFVTVFVRYLGAALFAKILLFRMPTRSVIWSSFFFYSKMVCKLTVIFWSPFREKRLVSKKNLFRYFIIIFLLLCSFSRVFVIVSHAPPFRAALGRWPTAATAARWQPSPPRTIDRCLLHK